MSLHGKVVVVDGRLAIELPLEANYSRPVLANVGWIFDARVVDYDERLIGLPATWNSGFPFWEVRLPWTPAGASIRFLDKSQIGCYSHFEFVPKPRTSRRLDRCFDRTDYEWREGQWRKIHIPCCRQCKKDLTPDNKSTSYAYCKACMEE